LGGSIPRKPKQHQEVVRDHVAQGAGLLVVGAAMLHADRFGHGDLDMIDVLAVPERLDEAVGEPKDHDVLDRLLAQIVVDAVDLVLVQGLVEHPVERLGAVQIDAEGLLDDDATPVVLALGGQPDGTEQACDVAEETDGGTAR
jgi:hypothetical protein